MLKRLCFAASIASSSILSVVPSASPALLPHVHTGIPTSIRAQVSARPLSDRIACSARAQAESMSSIGYCFRGVKRALNRVGVTLTGTAAYMARTQLAADNRFQMVSINQLRRGDILVHDRSAAHPYGHIAVYLGNGQEASDHVQHLVLGGRYGKTVAFRPKDGGNHLRLASSISRGRSPQAVALAFDRK